MATDGQRQRNFLSTMKRNEDVISMVRNTVEQPELVNIRNQVKAHIIFDDVEARIKYVPMIASNESYLPAPS